MSRRPAGGPAGNTAAGPDGVSEEMDQAIHLIRERGGRSTTPRRVVLEALLQTDGALITAEELLDHIQAAHPDFTESTVYRTLTLLEELELVDHVHLGHGPSHWYMSGKRRTWYLTCIGCGQVLRADPDSFERLIVDVVDRTGFTIDAGHFALTGLCAACKGSRSA